MKSQQITKYLGLLQKRQSNRNSRRVVTCPSQTDLTSLLNKLKSSFFLKNVQQKIKSKVLSPKLSKQSNTISTLLQQNSHSTSSKKLRQISSKDSIEQQIKNQQSKMSQQQYNFRHADKKSKSKILLNKIGLGQLQRPSLARIKQQSKDFKSVSNLKQLRMKRGDQLFDEDFSKKKYLIFKNDLSKQMANNTHYSRFLDGSLLRMHQQSVQCGAFDKKEVKKFKISSPLRITVKELSKNLHDDQDRIIKKFRKNLREKTPPDQVQHFSSKNTKFQQTDQQSNFYETEFIKKQIREMGAKQKFKHLKPLKVPQSQRMKRTVKAMNRTKLGLVQIGQSKNDISGWQYEAGD